MVRWWPHNFRATNFEREGGAVFGGLFGGALMVSRGRRTSDLEHPRWDVGHCWAKRAVIVGSIPRFQGGHYMLVTVTMLKILDGTWWNLLNSCIWPKTVVLGWCTILRICQKTTAGAASQKPSAAHCHISLQHSLLSTSLRHQVICLAFLYWTGWWEWATH